MLFDPEKYLKRTELALMVPCLEMPTNKVPFVNLGKLAADKKNALIKVSTTQRRWSTGFPSTSL